MIQQNIAWRAGLAIGTGFRLVSIIEDLISDNWSHGVHETSAGAYDYTVIWAAIIDADHKSLILLGCNPGAVGQEFSEEAWNVTILYDRKTYDAREFPDKHTLQEWMTWVQKHPEELLMEIFL